MAEGYTAARPAVQHNFTPDRAAAELPGLIGHDGQPPAGSVIIAATGPGGGRAVLVLAQHIDDPRVRTQTLQALAQVESDHLLLIGYGPGGERNALAVDDAIHNDPPSIPDDEGRFWATQILHAHAGRVRDPRGEWRLQPRPTYTNSLTPSEQARMVRSVAVEANELREQALVEQSGTMTDATMALRHAARLIVENPLMRDVAIAELIDQEDGLTNALALYGSAPGKVGESPTAAGLVAAVAAVQNPSSGMLRLTMTEGRQDTLWSQVNQEAQRAAREGVPFQLREATLTAQDRFTTTQTPGRHWQAVDWVPARAGAVEQTPQMTRATLESLAEATRRDLDWDGETAVGSAVGGWLLETDHVPTDGLYTAPTWRAAPLNITTADGLRAVVADVVSEAPLRHTSANSDLDYFREVELRPTRAGNDLSLA